MINPLAIRIAADLKEFKRNMQEMALKLETNQAAMKRMSNAFDGNKLIGDANAMAIAIDKIGGASKLTESEQRRVNAAVTEAIAKYKVLGREAPAQLLALRDATKQAQAPLKDLGTTSTSLASSMKGMAGTLGLTFGGAALVSGIKSLVSSTFDYAENISDLSKKMAVSAEAAQRWQFAAKQSGASLDDVDKAVRKLSVGLDGGDKSVRQALDTAGLSFEKIRAMKPEDAFNASVEAIAKIPDPMTQARVALELFGKAGAELLPAIRNGFDEVARQANVMADDTIEDLDRAKDEWEKFTNSIVVESGKAIGAIVRIREENKLMTEFKYDKAATTAKAYAEAVDSVTGAVNKAQAGLRTGLIPALMSAEEAEKAYMAAGGKTTQQLRAENDAAIRLAEAFQRQVDILTGKALTREVAELARQVTAAGKQGGISASEYQKLGKELESMLVRGAKLPPILRDIWFEHERLNPSIKVTTDAYKILADTIKGMKPFSLGMPVPTDTLNVSDDPYGIIQQIERSLILAGKDTRIKLAAAPVVKTWKDGFVSFMGQASMDMANSIVRAIEGGGSIVLAAMASLAQSAGQFFTTKFEDAVTAKKMSKGMAQIASGLVSGIVGLGVSIITDMFKPAYTAIEQVARAAGKTTKEIEAQLRQMGAAGVKAFEDMTRAGLSFENFRNRMKGMTDAQSLLGLIDQFQTKEELDKIAAQWKAAYDFMLTSGKYTAAQLAEAWKRYEDAQKAAIGAVDPEDTRPVGARGFATKAQLQQAVREAEEAYRYVRDSGLYTADVIEQAWQQWQDAMIASGDETAKRMKDLQSEIASLQKAVEAETPEYDVNGVRMYGVEELRNIERLAALEAEKAALAIANIKAEESAVEQSAVAAALQADKEFEAAKKRANNLDDYLKKLFSGGYEIPITFRLPDGSTPGQPQPPSFFGGRTTLPVPTPQASGNSRPIMITVVSELDGAVVSQKLVRPLINELEFTGSIRR